MRVCYPVASVRKPDKGQKLRIVSLAPSATSILCAIGAKKFLVGVTKWCTAVADVGELPQVGDCWRMESLEELLALKPTLVIGSVPYRQETVADLLKEPLNFLAMNPRTLADIAEDILLLGRISGCSAAARRTVARMHGAFARVANQHGRQRRARVYCEAWPNPRITSPPWVAEIVKIAGGHMIQPAGERVSEAQIAEAAPEVIVLAWAATGKNADPRQAYKIAAWKEVPAIRAKRVHVVSDELLNTPGPPLVKGAMELRRILTAARERA